MSVDKETEKNIQQLQLLEQNLQALLAQKQKFQANLIEVESAAKELETTDTAYRIIGNIMVRTEKEELKKDVENKKELLNLRIKTIEKQENSIREKAQKIQKTILGELNEK